MFKLDHLRRLVRKYDRPGPRYTSYPTAVDFSTTFRAEDYVTALRAADSVEADPWSVYVHIPFCRARCTFCACSVVASLQHDRIAPRYVEAVRRELGLVTAHLPRRRTVAQLHLGGGTPTYLEPSLLRGVYESLRESFDFTFDAESSIELDPRVTTDEHVGLLASLGVNRVSLGVQDLDPVVQEHIGRHQTVEQTSALVDAVRTAGIDSINVDLVYGLPGQTEPGLQATIDAITGLRVDRVALYGYAHVPWMRGNQRKINVSLLPGSEDRIDLLLLAQQQFQAAGYVPVGMDHFALPEDSLAMADTAGTLARNFMGYTVHAGSDLLGLGVTAIGDVRGSYVQNTAKLSAYYDALDDGRLPVARGLRCDREDVLRRRIISDLMCRHRLSRPSIEADFGLDSFDRHFMEDLDALAPLKDDGLIEDNGIDLVITPLGRLFVRNAAMCFDARLRAKRVETPQFSRTV